MKKLTGGEARRGSWLPRAGGTCRRWPATVTAAMLWSGTMAMISCCAPDEQAIRPEGVAQPVQSSNEDHPQRFEARRRGQRSDAGGGRQGDAEAYVSVSEPQKQRPSEPPARHDASERICGRMTHYVIEATTVVDADRAFLGLWTG